MISILFSLLLLATAGLALWAIYSAAKSDDRLLEYPLLLAAMWLYFYVFMGWGAATTLADYLPPYTYELGQAVALLALAAVLLGWRFGLPRKPSRPVLSEWPTRYSARRAWNLGATVMVVGAVAFYRFIGQSEIDWENTSAYWYLLFHVSYPAAGVCLMVMRSNAHMRTKGRWLAFAGLVALVMWPHVLNARRGPLFPMAIMLLLVGGFTSRTKPSRKVVLGSIAGVGVLMLLAVAVRPILYDERGSYVVDSTQRLAGWSEALSKVTFEDVFGKRVKQEGDNEYFYHCGSIATAVELSCYEYGTGYLSLLVHWIPRAVWRDKPQLGTGAFCSALDEMPHVFGREATVGASVGGVAEVFMQVGWFSPLLWFLSGYLASGFYRRAAEHNDPRAFMTYAGVLSASHWLVSQGFTAAAVPLAIYVAVPRVIFRLARIRKARLIPSGALPAVR
ncbi:hypothetical protein [Anaeromyxobacter paludicola]|uniref:Oligosaccharide repeat unit polymerase n=1 Tax=Anaeromyxobacter paludicola TaxID=2918171 RepID=A0ABN6N8V1_9BACT|nr:hypothetical protein [Anaeromyxobacter paludicola]BDG09639.1 hypothetical protein AMPC_27520 [Anaeromyxobacter paludicola]